MYKRQRDADTAFIDLTLTNLAGHKFPSGYPARRAFVEIIVLSAENDTCLLYTSDAADERSSVDLGGRRIIKKKKLKKK